VINGHKELEDKLMKHYKFDMFHYLFRLSIKQFNFQSRIHLNAFERYYIIYTPIKADIEKIFGITLEKIYLIGLSLTGYFLGSFKVKRDNLEATLDGIFNDDINSFL